MKLDQEALISVLHLKLFPEDFDHQYDSILDAQERRRGINPMSLEYQAQAAKRRATMGAPEFTLTGSPAFAWVREQVAQGHIERLQQYILRD